MVRTSYVDVVKKVDEVIGKLQVEEDNVVLEMMNTCRWENIDGANFMRYLDEGKQKNSISVHAIKMFIKFFTILGKVRNLDMRNLNIVF